MAPRNKTTEARQSTNTDAPRESDGKWKKGVSPNPGGRPKALAEIEALARSYSPEAIDTLAKIMKDETAPHAARAVAADKLLDRAFGKPKQTADVNVTNKFDGMTDDALREYIARGVNRLGINGGSGVARPRARVTH